MFLYGGSSGAWTWPGVAEHLPDRHLLAPGLPGYGERYTEPWPGLDGGPELTGYSRLERLLVSAQVPLWHRRWYWAAQAPLFRIPAEARQFVITRRAARTDGTPWSA